MSVRRIRKRTIVPLFDRAIVDVFALRVRLAAGSSVNGDTLPPRRRSNFKHLRGTPRKLTVLRFLAQLIWPSAIAGVEDGVGCGSCG